MDFEILLLNFPLFSLGPYYCLTWFCFHASVYFSSAGYILKLMEENVYYKILETNFRAHENFKIHGKWLTRNNIG